MRILSFCAALLVFATFNLEATTAFGFKGGGGDKGGGRVGGGAPPGGRRPASVPHMGGGSPTRPAMPTPRPPVTRPAVSRPNPNLPTARPSLPTARPTAPQARPTRPGGNGISGGMKPSLPSSGNRPTTLPGYKPATRPDVRPDTRPTVRPNFPSLGGGSNLGGGAGRPTTLPGTANRPSVNDVGDFLGISGGLKPANRPNLGNRPTTLPGTINPADRPSTLPSRPSSRPTGIPGRPGANPRPINVGNINIGNSVINNRPSWVQIDNNRLNAINNRWQTQIGGLHGWATTHPARINYWNSWGNKVRRNWRGYGYHNQWFAGDWWYSHPGGLCRWHYYHRFNNYPWNYWWLRPTWVVASGWFVWSAPSAVWSQPVYYDYGTGGNVTFQNNYVYIDNQQVASASEFAESAAALATVAPPESEEQAATAEWLPLGTFALSTHETDVAPTRVLQLAVDKSGIISGTLYNQQTDQADAIQGQVDKETQRVAFRIGESDTIIAETGLYNLTQDEAPLLIHFGSERVEQYVLVRLESSEEVATDDTAFQP